MINKIIDSLNWLYIGIAGIIFGVVSWLSIAAAGAFAKKTASLHWKDHIDKVSTQAANEAANLILSEIKKSNIELFETQKDNIRIEVDKFLKPVKEGLEVLQKSHKKTEKEVTKIKEEIAEIKRELEDSKKSRHASKEEVRVVLYSAIETIEEFNKVILELPKKQLKPLKVVNGLYTQN